jgi:hypothetical protein
MLGTANAEVPPSYKKLTKKQKGLMQRADTDINTILDNFSHLIKAARVNCLPSQPISSLLLKFDSHLWLKNQANTIPPFAL